MTKEEFLKSMNTSEEKLKKEKKEVVKFDDGDPECPGWEIRYIDEVKCVDIALGCKCSISNTLHDKL
ncbi:MAG: hypothetical protein DSY38_03770 [Fusobacteria bacterium]|nr:MAG: hypothetical protein DSY38_03770 [Fusobacteriota bacterium]